MTSTGREAKKRKNPLEESRAHGRVHKYWRFRRSRNILTVLIGGAVMGKMKKVVSRCVFDIPKGATIEVLQDNGPPRPEDALNYLMEIGTALGSLPKFSKLKRGWEVELGETEEVWFRAVAHELIQAYARR